MTNYLCINNQKIDLTIEQVEQIQKAFNLSQTRLSDFSAGDVVKIGAHELVVLEQSGDTAAVIRKELIVNAIEFSNTNNNFDGSIVDSECKKFADEIAELVGVENLVEHTVDLTSDDGLKDYGKIRRRASLLTADLYRRYVEILDKHKIDKWWWLATPHSTKRHENDRWVKCVFPSGSIDYCNRNFSDFGVRPFCILKSDIFVSKP